MPGVAVHSESERMQILAVSVPTRWAIRFAACLAIAVVSSFGTSMWIAGNRQPKAPLTTNLAGEWKILSAEFDRRVKAHFPIGTSVGEMGHELQKQGFSLADWGSAMDQERVAVRREDNWVCNQAAYVHWHADGNGRLTAIKGDYREEGCL